METDTKRPQLTLTQQQPISDDDLRHAIELLVSDVFPALNIANAFAGAQTIEWKIVRAFTPAQLFEEATVRGLPLESFRGAVESNQITASKLYQAWVGTGRRSAPTSLPSPR